MTASRRDFLLQGGATALGAAAWGGLDYSSADAAPPVKTKPTIIAVYLRGGADPLGAVIPHADPEFARHRPSLTIPGPGASGGVLPLDDRFGFNPNMKELHELYEKGMCVPIVAVGSPHATRSHFDAQDFMERGVPGNRAVNTGWLNRYLKATRTGKDANLRAVSLQSLLPRSMRGDYPVLAKPDQKAEQALEIYSKLYMDGSAKSKRVITTTGSGDKQTKRAIEAFGARTIEQLHELTNLLDQKLPGGAQYPNSGFGRQLGDIAKLIKSKCGMEATALDYGGWDHHINLGPTNGQMGRMLGDVSRSLGAFVEDLGPQLMKSVLVLVMSEFGRTVKENNNKGTDHGHGGFMLAIGGRLNGQRVYGKWLGLEDSKLYEKRDLPVLTDFRVVFAESLKGVFGFDGIKEKLFPEYTPDSPPLNFMQHA